MDLHMYNFAHTHVGCIRLKVLNACVYHFTWIKAVLMHALLLNWACAAMQQPPVLPDASMHVVWCCMYTAFDQ